jgi:hypothetical protein
MAAIWEANRIEAPALAARAPEGATSHHRHGRGQDVLDDAAHGGVEPAGGVHAQDHERRRFVPGFLQPAVHVVAGRRPDGTTDIEHHHLPGRDGVLGQQQQRPGHEQQKQHAQAFHTTHLTRQWAGDRTASRLEQNQRREFA